MCIDRAKATRVGLKRDTKVWKVLHWNKKRGVFQAPVMRVCTFEVGRRVIGNKTFGIHVYKERAMALSWARNKKWNAWAFLGDRRGDEVVVEVTLSRGTIIAHNGWRELSVKTLMLKEDQTLYVPRYDLYGLGTGRPAETMTVGEYVARMKGGE